MSTQMRTVAVLAAVGLLGLGSSAMAALPGAPEIDVSSGAGAIALLVGILVLVGERRTVRRGR
jgi:hypothetical protein